MMPSYGHVFLLPQFAGSELTASDINGGCSFAEVAGGIAWGYARYALTFGMDTSALAMTLVRPQSIDRAFKTAKGVIMFKGWNFGLQANLGLALLVGVLHAT